jgi:hypothetical protein
LVPHDRATSSDVSEGKSLLRGISESSTTIIHQIGGSSLSQGCHSNFSA